MHQLYFPNGFEKAKVRWEKIKIKLAHNDVALMTVAFIQNHNRVKAISFSALLPACDASCVDSSFFLFYEGMVRAR